MKRSMIFSMAVAALLLSTENIQAQTRQARNNRVQRVERVERVDDRYIPQQQPRRVRRNAAAVPVPPRRIKVVDNDVYAS